MPGGEWLVIEGRQQSGHVGRNRGLPFEGTAGQRMSQREARRMQRLARKSAQRRRQRRTAARGQPPAAAVYRIADDGIADVRQVYAYLVCPSGVELHAHESVGAITLDYAVMRDRFASITSHRHTRALRTVTSDGRIHSASTRHR